MPFDPAMLDPANLPLTQIVFIIMSVFVLGGGIGVVTSRNLFHSALYLVLSLFGVGGYYIILSAGFLAVVQGMVYIGAIAIVILFAIMFARRIMRSDEIEVNRQWWYSLPVAFVLFFLMVGVTAAVQWPVVDAAPTEDSVLLLGLAFLGSYLIPFMVVSVLLSVVLIGAIILARDKIEAEEAV